MEHLQSLVKCGDFLYSGKGTSDGQPSTKYKQEALKCYSRASELGCPQGMNNLALMLEHGVESRGKDVEQAISLYK